MQTNKNKPTITFKTLSAVLGGTTLEGINIRRAKKHITYLHAWLVLYTISLAFLDKALYYIVLQIMYKVSSLQKNVHLSYLHASSAAC